MKTSTNEGVKQQLYINMFFVLLVFVHFGILEIIPIVNSNSKRFATSLKYTAERLRQVSPNKHVVYAMDALYA